MGADLYIEKVFKNDPRMDVVGKKLDSVRELINALPSDNSEKLRAAYERREKAILDSYNRLWNRKFSTDNGYFRDSYNCSNLFWVLNLNYWNWLKDFLDGNGLLHPQQARLVLKKIEERSVTEAKIKHHFKKMKVDLGSDGKSPEKELKEWLDYFTEKREQLIGFLKMAIESDSPILCSI